MSTWRGDLRFGARTLLRSPGFAAIAVLCLAVGIGANAAIFSVLRATLFAPLPYDDPDQLVELSATYSAIGLDTHHMSEAEIHALRTRAGSIDSVAAFAPIDGNIVWRDGAPAQRVVVLVTDVGTFRTLGVAPALGRDFRPEESIVGNELVVVLSHELWMREFRGDPDALGRVVHIDAEPHEIIGVMPAGFRFPLRPDAEMFAPLALRPDHSRPDNRYLQAIARVRDGVALADTRAELARLADALRAERGELYPSEVGFTLRATPLRDALYGSMRATMLLLFGAVGLVLLIACANVASLLLARGVTREQEMALRVALGAGRWRLIRQLVAESLLLAVAGAIAGLLVALWSVDLLAALGGSRVAGAPAIAVDHIVLVFSAGLTAITGVAVGLFPALEASRVDLHGALKENQRATTGRRGQRLRGTLVAVEVALALVLLIGAGLMMKSLRHRQRADLGFRTDQVVTVKLRLPWPKYPQEPHRRAFYARLFQRLDRLPAAGRLAAVSQVPFDGNRSSTTCEGEGMGAAAPEVDVRSVTDDYFEVMNIPFRSGGSFTGRPAGVVIDELLARQLWPGQPVTGKRLRLYDGEWREVIGVVGNVVQDADGGGRPTVYRPFGDYPPLRMTLVARTPVSAEVFAAEVEREVLALDTDVPIYDVKSMDERVEEALAVHRFTTLLLGVFAGLALFLALVGIYALMTFSVAQRTREIGIRLALGARPRAVVAMLVRRGMALAAVGIAAGAVCALAAGAVLDPLLYGVGPSDPLTYVVVILAVAGSALVACVLAARRAARIDPMIAMRAE